MMMMRTTRRMKESLMKMKMTKVHLHPRNRKVVRVKPKEREPLRRVSQPTEEETIQYGIDSDDDEDVEFEKFEEDTREQYLLNFHPESRAVNFDEVKSLCTVIRDSDGDIIDDFHTTIPILTKYEKQEY